MPELRTRAGLIRFDDVGEGPPLVLLHANLHSRRDFAHLLPSLSGRYRVYAPDWPGYGESELAVEPEQVGAATFADTLEELAEAWGLKRALFIGNSVGGYAAARLAIRKPERVGGLVLVNSGGFTPFSPFTRAFCRAIGTRPVARATLPILLRSYLAPRSERDREVASHVLQDGRDEKKLRVYCSMWRSFIRPESDLRALASEIRARTIIIHGTRDRTSPMSFARVIHKLIPGSELQYMDAGHLPFVTEPEEFLEKVQAFFSTVPVDHQNLTI